MINNPGIRCFYYNYIENRGFRKSLRVEKIKNNIMKKLSKLVLKKEIVASLSNQEMNFLKGGYGTCPTARLYSCAAEVTIDGDDCLTVNAWTCEPNSAFNDCSHTAPPRCCYYGCCETLNCWKG